MKRVKSIMGFLNRFRKKKGKELNVYAKELKPFVNKVDELKRRILSSDVKESVRAFYDFKRAVDELEEKRVEFFSKKQNELFLQFINRETGRNFKGINEFFEAPMDVGAGGWGKKQLAAFELLMEEIDFKINIDSLLKSFNYIIENTKLTIKMFNQNKINPELKKIEETNDDIIKVMLHGSKAS